VREKATRLPLANSLMHGMSEEVRWNATVYNTSLQTKTLFSSHHPASMVRLQTTRKSVKGSAGNSGGNSGW
jgi:hypothetical protein